MTTFTDDEMELLERLRKVSTFRRRRLLLEAEALDARDPKKREQRLRHLQRAIALWSRSAEETEQLIAEIYADREIEE